MIEVIRKCDPGVRLLIVGFISSFITAVCSLITPKIGEAIRIISIYDVFATSASFDWTTPTTTGMLYGKILNVMIFLIMIVILWIYFGTNILKKLKE
jgi:hypothetical protein